MKKNDTKNKDLGLKTLAIILLIIATPYYIIVIPNVFLGFAIISSPYDYIVRTGMMAVGVVASLGIVYNSFRMIIKWNQKELIIIKESIFLLFLLLVYINTREEPTGVIIDFLESLI